ncbi:PD-(D/E)XK motif protein [Mesorhizobium sp.]|uniref:PD-(D/E)XK motif protein n=1 Tax=Mesorhizobium sp. TaxID=1871066 RepID=UPI0025F81B14|nr:PD-(D/E)XK motif protein [Mesorhizobium sp.]
MAVLTDTDELEAAWGALAGQRTEKGFLTVALGHSKPRFRVGIMFPEGDETLLVGFNVDVPPAKSGLPEGSGFRVELAREAPAPGFAIWVCLIRQPGAGRDLFVQMSADIVAALSATQTQSDSWLLSLMLARIRAWQEFMRRPRSGLLSPEEEIGLFGELVFLREALDAGAPAAGMLHSWAGPAGGLQDFQTETVGIEIKSTISASGFPAQISSLEQLDGLAGRAVILGGVRLCQQEGGQTLSELVGGLRMRVAQSRDLAGWLDRSLLLAGYEENAASRYLRRYDVVDTRFFEVDGSFPCLRRSSTVPVIRSANYQIDLDLVEAATLSLSETLVRYGVLPA